MLYHLGVEDVEPQHWVAYVFELPACFSSAHTRDEALAGAPERIRAHLNWLSANGATTTLSAQPIQTEIAEEFRSFALQGGYLVNALFHYDRQALSHYDVDVGLWLLENTRRDLLEVIRSLDDEAMQARRGDLQQSIEEIILHLAWAEWWYIDRLGCAFVREAMPLDPLVALRHVREQFVDSLPALVGDERLLTRSGEQWTARKVLRRALWHERDHTEQMTRLLSG